jgi:hypothetical protein
MDWFEMQEGSNNAANADKNRALVLDSVKEQVRGKIKEEKKAGSKQFKQVRFQPVRSPGIYEAEFGAKGKDLIFHFWPHGYHSADAQSLATPRFSKEFLPRLKTIMSETFGHNRVEIKQDPDVGAIFVKANNWGESQFCRELAIKACEAVHQANGGKDS